MENDHDLLLHLIWRVDALDVWRDKVDSWRGGVDRDFEMIHKQEIEQAVRKQMRREAQTLRLTREQKALGLLGLALAAFDALKGLWS